MRLSLGLRMRLRLRLALLRQDGAHCAQSAQAGGVGKGLVGVVAHGLVQFHWQMSYHSE